MSIEENINKTKVWPAEELNGSADQPLLLSEAHVNPPTKLPTACLTITKEASAVVFNYFITSFASMTSYNFLKGTAPEEVLGAYGIASSFLNIAVFSIIISLNYGLLTKLSHANGSKKYHLMGNYLHQGFLINILVVLFITVICFFSAIILKAFGYDPTVADNIRLFLIWDIGAMFFYMIYSTLNYYLSACKIFKPAALMQLIAAPAYIAVSYYLIKVQDLGLKGAALASTTMYGILAILMACYIYFKRPAPEALFAPSRQIFSGLWKLFKDEVMVGSMVFAEWVGLEIIALTAGILPLEYLTAYPITYSIMSLANNFPLALSTVFTSYISNNLAENKPSEAKTFFKATLLITVSVALVIISLFATIGDQIASLMVDDPDVAQDVLEMLRIYSIALLFDYSQQILGGALRAANKKKLGFYVAMSSMYIIAIPLAMVLCFVLKWKIYGLITGIDLGAMTSFTSYTVAHFRLNWKAQAKTISQKLAKPEEEKDV